MRCRSGTAARAPPDADQWARLWNEGIIFGEAHQHADPPHSIGLLRAHRERQCRCHATEKRDELAPSHELPSDEANKATTSLDHVGAVHPQQNFPGYVGSGSWLCENSSARRARRNSQRNCAPWSRIVLRARCSIPCWRIVFSTFRNCMSFHTGWVIHVIPAIPACPVRPKNGRCELLPVRSLSAFWK